MDAFKKQTNNQNAFGMETLTQMRWMMWIKKCSDEWAVSCDGSY